MIRIEFKLKGWILFDLKENIIIKAPWDLLVRHGDKSFTNQTLNLEPYVGSIF